MTPCRLIDKVKTVLERLEPLGWGKIFLTHGLDIKSSNLATELGRELERIDRTAVGFKDFSSAGRRGIEPGRPERSLVYHAMASPQVLEVEGYPTPAEIETVENYVYSSAFPSIQDLRARANGAPLAIVVFAKEYRAAVNTVHQKHADLCFSRSGISRVGTAAHSYLPEARGYLPFVEGNGKSVRVVPCRYAAYISALVPGDFDLFGPMSFITGEGERVARGGRKSASVASITELSVVEDFRRIPDSDRKFWVPLHKIFSGDECVRNMTINVNLVAEHQNEKLRRVHLRFGQLGHDGGWHGPCLHEPPFLFKEGIAEFSSDANDGMGLLVPVVHDSLVEVAKTNCGKEVSFCVPDSSDEGAGTELFSSTLELPLNLNGTRSAPEYVHARSACDYQGKELDLNELANVVDIVKKGGYRAKHYVDFTGDGWIGVRCPELSLEIPRQLSAFSIVAPPDFFPGVKQRDLMQWWRQSVPPSLRETIWPSNPGHPEFLSDQRYPANLELSKARFEKEDDTMTAIVSALNSSEGAQTLIDPPVNRRSSMLPDGASGVFAPGWDVSIDRTSEIDASDSGSVRPGTTFLATYGLGSPFPEDAKLCAALSSYWPAAAPDITRTFGPSKRYATATPLTDEVIGMGQGEPWDGVRGPTIFDEASKTLDYPDLAYGDYVLAALRNEFNIEEIGKTSANEYIARTVSTARVYDVLGAKATLEKALWTIFSFKKVNPENDSDLSDALGKVNAHLNLDYTYRFLLYGNQCQENQVSPDDHRRFRLQYKEMHLLYADPMNVISKDDNGNWKLTEYRD